MFHNFPLKSFPKLNLNVSKNQNTYHMLTNFDNYTSTNEKININCRFNGINRKVQVYDDILFEDLINKFLWDNNLIHYKESKLDFLINGRGLKKDLTLSENGIENDSTIFFIYKKVNYQN